MEFWCRRDRLDSFACRLLQDFEKKDNGTMRCFFESLGRNSETSKAKVLGSSQ
jgi:hypothetical protein